MINIKPDVVNALLDDAELISLLGGPRVYFHYPPNPAEFPRITYYEIDNVPIMVGGEEIAADIFMIIDVWNKGGTSTIALRVDAVMAKHGFKREFAHDLVEIQKNGVVHHKTMRYKIKKGV